VRSGSGGVPGFITVHHVPWKHVWAEPTAVPCQNKRKNCATVMGTSEAGELGWGGGACSQNDFEAWPFKQLLKIQFLTHKGQNRYAGLDVVTSVVIRSPRLRGNSSCSSFKLI
jgi:hypothetical protein